MAENVSECVSESVSENFSKNYSENFSENFSERAASAENTEKVVENTEIIAEYSAKESIQIMTTSFSENFQIEDRKVPKFNYRRSPDIAFQDEEADAILHSFSEIARQNILNLCMIWNLLRNE